jgi:hypothetical protein
VIRTVLGIMLALILLSLGMAILLASDAGAQEPNDSQCYTVPELEADNATAGGIISGAAYYEGINSDTVIIIQGKREILALLFKDGCFVGMEGVDLTAMAKGDPA